MEGVLGPWLAPEFTTMFGLSRGGLPVAWMGMAMIAAGIGISPLLHLHT